MDMLFKLIILARIFGISNAPITGSTEKPKGPLPGPAPKYTEQLQALMVYCYGTDSEVKRV